MSDRCRKHMARPVLGRCTACERLREQERRRWNSSARFFLWLMSNQPFRLLSEWSRDAFEYLRGKTGYRVVVPVIVTLVGAYFGLYAIMEARHERRLNRAAFERSAFTDLVTSNNRGAFIAAMKRFGPIQTMEVPAEPYLWMPWNWWGKPDQPNKEPLRSWAQHFFSLCTPQDCGEPDKNEPQNQNKGTRINLREADLYSADLHEVDLRGAGLHRADLREANLYRADLRNANLHRADLRGSNLNEADLREAGLYKADLQGADLNKAKLSQTNLYGARLMGVNLIVVALDRVNLIGANLDGTNLNGIYFHDIKYDATTIWPAGFTPPPSR